MSLLKLRTWVVLASMLAVGTPVLAAHKARVDRQIQNFEQHGVKGQKLRLIVQPDGTVSSKNLLQTLRNRGVKVRRQHSKIGRFSIEVSPKDLAWVENLNGLGAVSIDSPMGA